MRYALIREMDISNGRGVGVSLFVQGCHFHCKGCFNPETWDFDGGKEWTNEIEDQFITLAKRPYIKRISILGGEPLANENVCSVLCLLERITRELPDKEIWLYTGYTLWEIKQGASKDVYGDLRYQAAHKVDYLVDGRFEIDKQDTMNKEIVFAGSTNQRIIAMRSEEYGES